MQALRGTCGRAHSSEPCSQRRRLLSAASVGYGFIASVTVNGRALLAEEDDNDFWIYGVQPGGVAGGNPQRDLAFNAFRTVYMSALLDIAAESASFDDFRKEVRAFFETVNAPNATEWGKALAEVRARNLNVPDLKRVENADSLEPTIEIELIQAEKAKPTINPSTHYAEAA